MKITFHFAILVLFSLASFSCGKKEESSTAVPLPKEEKVTSTAPSVTAPENKPPSAPVASPVVASPASASTPTPTPTAAIASTRETLVQGVQELLTQAARQAMAPTSGQNASSALISLPEAVEKVRQPLTAAGQSGLLQQFSQALQQSAGESIAQAGQLIPQAAAQLSTGSLDGLLKSSDGATQLLKKTSYGWLKSQLQPIAKQAIEKTGAGKAYQDLRAKLPQGSENLLGSLGKLAGFELPTDPALESYVTDFALEQVFTAMAGEEAKIRADPAAYSAKIQQLFQWQKNN